MGNSTGVSLETDRQAKWDRRFLEMAKLVSTWSKDPSTKVGAVIVDDVRIISLGYNGFAQAMPDVSEHYEDRDEKLSRIVHAEANAIMLAHTSVRSMTIYVHPFMPCDRCAVQVIQAGIKRVLAPLPTDAQNQRWGKHFEKSRRYFAESGVILLEVSAP